MSELDEVLSRGGKRVFLHDYLASGARLEWVTCLGAAPEHTLAERALLLSQPWDLVIASAPLDRAYSDYVQSLSSLPLFGEVVAPEYSLAENYPTLTSAVMRDRRFIERIAERLTDAGPVRLSSYYPTPQSDLFRCALEKLTRSIISREGASPSATEYANRKELVYDAALESGVQVACGSLVAQAADEPGGCLAERVHGRAKKVLESGAKCIIRGCRSQSGLDTIVLHTLQQLQSLPCWLDERRSQTHYLVEQFVTAQSSPNVQGWIADDGTIEPLSIVTNQRLDTFSAHYGNSFPHDQGDTPEIRLMLEKVSKWLVDSGYKGSVGIDLITAEAFEQPVFVELNARMNAATYFISLHEKLNHARLQAGYAPLAAWVSHKKMPTQCRSFEQLEAVAGDLLYAQGKNEGCLPVVSAMLPFGYVMLVTYAASVADAAELEREFNARVS